MKKLFLILSVALFALGTVNAFAQEAAAAAETQLAGDSLHHVMMQKFLEGGWAWMLPILIFLIIGLAVAIERILYLSLSTINSKKLITKVEEALKNGGIEAAKEVCRNTRGPIASIYYQGLDRYDQGLDSVEKAVVSYGSVQTGQMESGLTWIGLFIALSPMLGFMGTVVGMIAAFDAIQAAGDISPTLVAGGIKVALLTTLMGLIAAVILQLFYNYIVSKIDSLVNDMEVLGIYAIATGGSEAAISLNLIWCYFLLALAVFTAIFCAVFGMIQNPAGIKGTIISLALIIVIVGVAYFVASGHDIQIPDLANGGFFSQGETVLTDTSILVTYVALVAAFVTAIATEIYGAFK